MQGPQHRWRNRRAVQAKFNWAGVKNVAWAGIEAVSSVLVSIVALLGIARLIGPTEFGLGALGLGTVQILSVVIGSLFHDALVRDPRVTDKHVNVAWTISLIIAIAAVALCVTLATPLAGYYEAPKLAAVFIAFSLTLIPDAVVAPLIAERRRALDFRLVTVQYLIARLAGALVGVAMAVAGYGVWSMVAQQLITSALGLVIILWRTPFRVRPLFDLGLLKPLLIFTSSIIATQFVIQFAQRIILFYVGRVSGITAAGYWGLADRIVDTLQVTITNALYHVSLSHFAKVQDRREQLGNVIRQANHWLVPTIFPSLVLVAIFGTDIIGFLLGDQWLPAGIAAQILAIGAIIQLRRLMDHVGLNALGHSGIALQAYLLEAVLTTAALFLFMPSMLWAIAVFRAIQPLYGYCLIVYRSAQRTMRRWEIELLDVTVDILLIAATALVVWNVKPYLASQNIIIVLIIAGIIAMATAALLCLILRPTMVRSAWSQIRDHPRFQAIFS